MSEITLSKAVRSNLLNLQSTASLLSKSQERLSSGLRVNSALDNPTNFFTAQGLNSRANDLSQLSDAVSNAVQTVAAADKGISAITKLVESAQATARQALQTAATVSTGTAADAGTVSAGGFTTLNVSGAGSAAQNASVVGTSAITPIVVAGAQNAELTGSGAITPITLNAATNAEATATSAYSPVDASGGGFSFEINGQAVTLSATGGTNSDGIYTLSDMVQTINTQVGVSAGVVAADDGNGNLQITSTGTAGAADAVTIDTFAGTGFDATDLGFAGATVSTNGSAAQSLTFQVNNQTVTLGAGTHTGTDIATAITNQVGVSAGVSASYANNALTVTSTGTAGASDAVTIGTFSSGDASQLGFAAQASVTDNGSNAGSLTFQVNNQTVTLGAGTHTGTDIATAITNQVGVSAGVSASYANNALTVTSTGTAGASDAVTIGTFSSGNASQLGLAAQASVTDNGSNLVAADSVSFSLAVDGASPTTITIDAAAVTAYNTANNASLSASALSAQNVADIINHQSGPNVASVVSGALTFTSTTTGTGSSIAITGYSASATAGSTGIANNSDTGSASSTTSGVNPKRAELVNTYNDLLGQIDALAKDASFNGVNLLNGDDLSVLFNEDGSSSLQIDGVTNTSTGLGLTALGTTAFDTNTSINSTLDDLKASIDTLRSQSAKFGSNLSVVETRQDFTKQMISVLQTGAANLTLADTNEEAANVLALQTRQQLSSTALSLASQADQNVLRLF
jgi:flagellin